ncbi:hypothetical protein MCEZEM1_02201 [Comamonadaceae bacterium]
MNIHSILKQLFYRAPLADEAGGQVIRAALESRRPAMIARFGSVEIKGVLYPLTPSVLKPIFRKRVFTDMKNNAGFFSVSEHSLDVFSSMMVEDMRLLDVLGSWRAEERLLEKEFLNAHRVDLKCLEPYLSKNPWSEMLTDKKVLVVHPFSRTIEHQYFEKRALLFQDQRVLPEFQSLQTIKAVQTVAGGNGGFATWFEALGFMKSQIDSKDFDVAILGCGAYGFPLAAHIKRMGKQAVHMGGPTQILFGIKGNRWDHHPVISKLYNDYWVRPTADDRPANAEKVENGCYW